MILFKFVFSIMFFTKWGHSAPALEQCSMNGTMRKSIVDHKIVYPYGVAVDIPSRHVYWVDTYLDFVERVDYDGKNRKTVKKGHPVISCVMCKIIFILC